MTDPNAHITNLECPDRMRRDYEQAASAHMADPSPESEARMRHAQAVHEATQATLALLEQEWGPVTIGKPRKTKWKSSELLAEQGYIGVYRRG